MNEHGLGRVPSPPDPRDFSMAAAMRELAPTPRPVKTWPTGIVLDQGVTQHCVGYSAAAWGICAPVRDTWSNTMGEKLYYRAKVIDGEPRAENGSHVRSGLKALKAIGRVQAYYFAASIEEAAEYVARYGPVMLGTVWTTQMFTPDWRGIIHIGGYVRGGHAYLWRGVDGKYATIRNSWGADWGKGGDCRIALSDLQFLFDINGEACAATESTLAIGDI